MILIADILHNLTNSFPYFLCSGCASPGTYSFHFSKKNPGGFAPLTPTRGAAPGPRRAGGCAPRPLPQLARRRSAPQLARRPTVRRCSLRLQHNPPKLFGLDPSLLLA